MVSKWDAVRCDPLEVVLDFGAHTAHLSGQNESSQKLMSLREGLHVMMQCYMRQHFADRYWLHEHPGGHASWRELTMREIHKRIIHLLREKTCVQMECSEDANRIE